MRQADRPSTLHFTEHGAGLPIVNLHGWPAEHGQMMAMMEPLFASRPGWRRIYVDLPGMGLSPGPDWLVSHDQMLEAVSDFIGAVVGDQRVVLAGHSYGAALARGLMAQDGSRVGAAFLLSPGGSEDPPEEAGPPTVFSESQEFLDALTEQEREFAGLFRVHSLNVLDTVRRQAMPGVIAADHEFLTRVAAGPDFSYLAQPDRRFCGPVLILSGRQEPAGYSHLWHWLDSYPRGTCAILDRTGHFLFAEQPSLLAALADEWLDRVQEYFTMA
jgi:pimeloyl-ACP methyl ester carboxylesterase